MATITRKGWVPKDERNKETIRILLDDDSAWPYRTQAECMDFCGEPRGNIKQVELTLTCKDVQENSDEMS